MASLVKVSSGKVPARAVQFTDPDGNRRTIRLGKCGLEPAREFKRKVEILLSHTITNAPLDAQTSAWVAGLLDKVHAKLAAVRLVEPREPPPTAPTLGAWLDKYIGQRKAELKPASIAKLGRTACFVRRYFGTDIAIDAIAEDSAHDWRAWLRSQGINDATAGTHVRNVKQIFTNAVKRKLIGENPFANLIGPVGVADRDRYVASDEADAILDAFPGARWRVLIGLARFAGLRVPSETHILTWADVDWDRGRLSVYSPKTERYEKHRRRTVPITPQLMRLLQDAFDAAEDGQERVCGLSRNNLHRMVQAILKRAGIVPFRRFFQVLRQSCDTEWKQTFPSYAVDVWLGHSERVSERHYLMIPDDVWDRAAGLVDSPDPGAAKCAAVSSRTESQGLANSESDKGTLHPENPRKIGVFVGLGGENATSGARDRTGDLGFMNPTL